MPFLVLSKYSVYIIFPPIPIYKVLPIKPVSFLDHPYVPFPIFLLLGYWMVLEKKDKAVQTITNLPPPSLPLFSHILFPTHPSPSSPSPSSFIKFTPMLNSSPGILSLSFSPAKIKYSPTIMAKQSLYLGSTWQPLERVLKVLMEECFCLKKSSPPGSQGWKAYLKELRYPFWFPVSGW